MRAVFTKMLEEMEFSGGVEYAEDLVFDTADESAIASFALFPFAGRRAITADNLSRDGGITTLSSPRRIPVFR